MKQSGQKSKSCVRLIVCINMMQGRIQEFIMGGGGGAGWVRGDHQSGGWPRA